MFEWGETHGVHLRANKLAELSGISASAISKWLKDDEGASGITLRQLGKLCDALDCSPADLLERIPPMPATTIEEIVDKLSDEIVRDAKLQRLPDSTGNLGQHATAAPDDDTRDE
jgi:DNA-binding Xre family transcriptional regulator